MLHSLEIGKKIEKYRASLQISQTLLAKLLGVSSQAVSKWECGTSIPDINNLVMLTEIFGIRLETMLDYRCDFDAPDLRTKSLISQANYSIVVKKSNQKLLPNSFKKNRVENVFYLEFKQDNMVISNFITKKCVYSKCICNNSKCTNSQNIDVIYVDSIYENADYDNCTFEHCQQKLNVTSGKFNRVKFIYNIYLSEKLHDTLISNSELSYSSYTNFVLTRVTIVNSLWDNNIMYNSLFTSCVFRNLTIRKCKFKNCTFVDCTFDKKAYKQMNTKQNKIIRPIVVD